MDDDENTYYQEVEPGPLEELSQLATIVVENLSRVFVSGGAKLTALENLNLTLEAGDVFGFIGPNGAGKTTTIKILATLLRPTSGTAVVCGHDVVQDPFAVRRSIGYMPDFFGVYDDIKVWEYLDFFAAAYKLPRNSRSSVIAGVLDLTDLKTKKEAYVETLSRGMKQRLCLAKTLLHDPPVLLLDEPASGLDPRARIEIRELLKELQTMGKTIIVSSHILPEMEEFCNKVGIIEKGHLIVSGEVKEIRQSVRGSMNVELRVAGDEELATAVLKRLSGVSLNPAESSAVTAGLEPIRFVYSGTPGSEHQVLTSLVTAGVKVLSFYSPATDLEEIFMKVTKGAVN